MPVLKWAREQWDRVAAIAFGLAGALAVVLGWVGASNALYPAKQLPYIISGGLGGLFLVAVTATSWLSADLRDEWRKLDRIEAELSELNRHLDRLPTGDRASITELRVEGSDGEPARPWANSTSRVR